MICVSCDTADDMLSILNKINTASCRKKVYVKCSVVLRSAANGTLSK